MTNEELKKKIAEELKKAMEPIEYGGDSEHAPEVHCPTEEEIADALIAAGLRFGENLTATFDRMALEREHELERRLAEAEYWKSVYDLALNIAFTGGERAYYLKRAQEELKGESVK